MFINHIGGPVIVQVKKEKLKFEKNKNVREKI